MRSIVGLVTLAVVCAAAVASADAQTCGMRPNDWCPVPASDTCGRHPNVAACRADAACYGMPYQGESVVACEVDGRGFGKNCPTVGCTSSPPRR